MGAPFIGNQSVAGITKKNICKSLVLPEVFLKIVAKLFFRIKKSGTFTLLPTKRPLNNKKT
jgi:hypothetical protein